MRAIISVCVCGTYMHTKRRSEGRCFCVMLWNECFILFRLLFGCCVDHILRSKKKRPEHTVNIQINRILFFVEIRRRIKCRRTNIALLLSRTWFGIIRWENNGILSSFFSTLVQLLIHERSHIKRVLLSNVDGNGEKTSIRNCFSMHERISM